MDKVDYQKPTIQDLLNYHKQDELDLNPWYQRRSVWTDPQRAYLINTIFEQKPVPSIYVRHTIDIEKEKSIREIVDGQQRLRSIIGYKDGDFAARHPNYKVKKKYADLKPSERHDFLMTSLSVGYLLGASESDVIEIFGRINSVSKTLNAQEKRNALFSGDFKQFSVSTSSLLIPFWRSRNVFSANDISRMAEVEFTSDLAMNLDLGLQDYSSARLDKYYATNDDTYPKWVATEATIEKIFAKLSSMDVDAIRDTVFRRPPLLFSLCVVLKDNLKIASKGLREIVAHIDSKVQAASEGGHVTKADAAFVTAISSSTQRIASRTVRDKYIRSMF